MTSPKETSLSTATAVTSAEFDPNDMLSWRAEDLTAQHAQGVDELGRTELAASYGRITRRIAATYNFVERGPVRELDVLQSIADSLARIADAIGAKP